VKVVLISNDRFSGSKVIRRKVDESVESAFEYLENVLINLV
jgi:hypothetical protein